MRSKSCAGTQNDEIQISHPIMWTSDGQQENDNKTKIRATATTMATTGSTPTTEPTEREKIFVVAG